MLKSKPKTNSKPKQKPTKIARTTTSKYIPWDLYRDGINTTGLRIFRSCREQFRLRFLEGWTSTGVSRTEFGILFHRILELGSGDKDFNIAEEIAGYERARAKEVPFQDRDKLSVLCAQVQVVAEAYFKFWIKRDRERVWRAKEVELESVSRPIPSPPAGYLKEIKLRGRIDGILKEGKTHRIHEIKTRSQIDEEGIAGVLPFDMQTMLYSYAVRQMYGIEPVGVLYDVIRRPNTNPHKGRGKNPTPESLKDYKVRLGEDILSRPEWYFMRWKVDYEKGEIDRFLKQQLDPVLRELVAWYWEITSLAAVHGSHWKSNAHWLNDEALYGRYGRCDLFEAITRNRFTGLKQIHPLHHLQ